MSAAEASPLPTLASSNVITPDNHGAYVTITALLMLVSMVLLTGLRLSIRFPFRQLFGIDDAAIVISAICATAQTVVTIQAVKFGLGRHAFDLTDYQRDTAQKLIYVGNVLFVISLSFSKTATSLLMSRLTRARNQIVVAYVTSAIIMVWGIAFILGVSINCNASRPWDMRADRCSNWEIWTAFGAIGLFFELLLAILPAYLLSGLQMSTACKATVAFGFCFRLIIVPIEAFRLHYLSRTLPTTDPTFDTVPFLLLTQVEQHYSLIAATIPCLRPFLTAAHTGLLDVNPTQVEQCGSNLNSGGTGRGSSYAMRSMDTRASSARPPSKLSVTKTRYVEVATGFRAFDASNEGGVEVPLRKDSWATTVRNLDSIALAPSEPMSASPTVAKHMFVTAAVPAPGVSARATAASPREGDDSSFTSEGSEKMIIRKETDLSVRYSPVARRSRRGEGEQQLRGGGMPVGLDLERIEEGPGVERGKSLEIGRARGESLDVRRDADVGRIPIGLSVERMRRESADSGTGRLGSWLETETPKGRGSWDGGGDGMAVAEAEWRYKESWRQQRERYWSRR